MIRITRCAEPVALREIRETQLALLRALKREPVSKEIQGYGIVAPDLWRSQHHKCCYCEHRIARGFNDVEHYRPKSRADRGGGYAEKHGYWWLAFTWSNLLFACPACNRSNKNSRFPLQAGASVMHSEDLPPGGEVPLLIDPGSGVNPVEHIEFVYRGPAGGSRYWWARPRNGSPLGNETIDVCGLNRLELLELREDHYQSVIVPHVSAMGKAIGAGDKDALYREFCRALGLLEPRNAFVGLTYDALRVSVSDLSLRALLGCGWPTPDLVA